MEATPFDHDLLSVEFDALYVSFTSSFLFEYSKKCTLALSPSLYTSLDRGSSVNIALLIDRL